MVSLYQIEDHITGRQFAVMAESEDQALKKLAAEAEDLVFDDEEMRTVDISVIGVVEFCTDPKVVAW